MEEIIFNKKFSMALKEQYPLFVAMSETVHEMIFLLDSERRLVFFNQRYKKFAEKHNLSYEYGLRPGEAFKCVNALLGDKLCGDTSFCKYCGASKSIINASEESNSVEDCKVISLNGSAYDLRVSTSKLNLFDEPYTLYCIVDISSENRKQALEKIFFHDINNLAGGISMIVDMIDSYVKSEDFDSLPEVVSLLKSAMSNMNNEIKSSFMLSLAEKNELEVHHKEVDLNKVFETTRSFFSETSIDKNVIFRTEYDSSQNIFLVDESIITRILINMTKNAAEASVNGDTVVLGYKYDGKNITLYVKNPTVMPEEIKKSVFKRSFSTKGIGRGLGTYSMRLLTERYLKGKVYFTSEEGQGTAFYAEIPVTP